MSPATFTTTTVPSLSATFEGVTHPLSTPEATLVQYRGIKYASIPARFRRSKLISSYPSHVNATEFGPVCPQSAPVFATQPSALSDDQPLPEDEFECLNLNITCPPSTGEARLPVMLWIHGGPHRGSGSSWLYDGGALVLKGMSVDKPIVVVTINYRLGLFGSASSVQLREDNRSAGDEGVGNYGLYDQQVAISWVRANIAAFGGDPENITLFGEGTGAADVLCHMQSVANHAAPQFARAIAQSPLGAPDEATTVQNAGWMLSRLLSSQGANDVAAMRALDAKKLVSLAGKYPVRMVNDGVFFHPSALSSNPKPAPQPLLVGDNSFAPVVHMNELMNWAPGHLTKRVHAIIQSMKQSNALLRAYDISACTPETELADRLVELVGDARWAYPTERAASLQARGTAPVFRYVWDQEPHEAADGNIPVDVAFLFDTVPAPTISDDSPFDTDVFDEDLDDLELEEIESSQSSLRSNSSASSSFSLWTAPPPVDRYCYAHVRDAVQERWLAFASGEEPWEADRVYVFGPEGECGARSRTVFTGRRRTRIWEDTLAPLGAELVMKLGTELANGPSS